MGAGALTAAWLAWAGTATFKWHTQQAAGQAVTVGTTNPLPPPGLFLAGNTVFSLLGLLAMQDRAAGFAATMGWALVVATWLTGFPLPRSLFGAPTTTGKAAG